MLLVILDNLVPFNSPQPEPAVRLLCWKYWMYKTQFLPPSSPRSKSKSEEEWKGSPAKHSSVEGSAAVECFAMPKCQILSITEKKQ